MGGRHWLGRRWEGRARTACGAGEQSTATSDMCTVGDGGRVCVRSFVRTAGSGATSRSPSSCPFSVVLCRSLLFAALLSRTATASHSRGGGGGGGGAAHGGGHDTCTLRQSILYWPAAGGKRNRRTAPTQLAGLWSLRWLALARYICVRIHTAGEGNLVGPRSQNGPADPPPPPHRPAQFCRLTAHGPLLEPI